MLGAKDGDRGGSGRVRRRMFEGARGGLRLGLGMALLVFGSGCGDATPQEELPIRGSAVPEPVRAEARARQQRGVETLERVAGAAPARPASQILFGDLHVHTTFSYDAYLFSLPALGGEGVHPPADACDFARYCANLDFFALTDHAESLRPEHWELSKQSIRECNALASDAEDPDLVAFMGFEWSQAGLTPETHYGHRCLVFPETDDASLPPRPIAAADRRSGYLAIAERLAGLRWTDPLHWTAYTDYVAYADRLLEAPLCEAGIPTPELPAECLEVAETPEQLHRKLDEWGGRVLEIPHGMAWGVYTPATASLAKHLEPESFDPERQRLIELFSGHGSSEIHPRWRERETAEDGSAVCPAPTEDYLPCCWQAGEIMRSRCGDLDEAECDRRVELSRAYALEAWTRPHRVFPDAEPEEWLDCGQCRDCFKPAFLYRPRESVQYGMALSHPEAVDEEGEPLRFRYGFVASSDEHSARPGVGYKAVDRGLMTDVNEVPAAALRTVVGGGSGELLDMPVRPEASETGVSGNDGRTQAFLYPGGLAAVHAASRRREDLWDAMQRREVYATSGPRILLWFDLLNPPRGEARPMGSEVEMVAAPRFEVRALGSFEPKPGCPDWAEAGLGAQRLDALCHGECYFPSDERRPIEAIEVVRITPQVRGGEDVGPLIEDPWRRYECSEGADGCVVRFADDEFPGRERDTLYYVRALEAPRPAILGDPLRPRRDADGRVVEIEICDTGDDCLDDVRERAWSSPIFVDHAGRATPRRSGSGV